MCLPSVASDTRLQGSGGVDDEFLTCHGVSGSRWAVHAFARFVFAVEPFSGSWFG
jgi:hypothetical protein